MAYISFPAFSLQPRSGKRLKTNAAPRTAGLIGGLAPQSTSFFYEAATQYCLQHGLPAIPRLVINSINTWEVTDILDRKDMRQLFRVLLREARLIEGQSDFLAIICNSVHTVIEPLRRAMRIPVLCIYEEVCREVAGAGLKKVGILGTKTTTGNCFYQEELATYGIGFTLLPDGQEEAFDRFIFEEMIRGRGLGTMKKLILEGVDYLKGEGCDGVVLACTELPIFVRQEDVGLPLFSSTEILAQAVMKQCFRLP